MQTVKSLPERGFSSSTRRATSALLRAALSDEINGDPPPRPDGFPARARPRARAPRPPGCKPWPPDGPPRRPNARPASSIMSDPSLRSKARSSETLRLILKARSGRGKMITILLRRFARMVTAFSGAYTLELRRRSNLATFPILPTFTMLRTLVLLVCVALASAFQPVMSTGVLRSAITATDVSPLMLVRLRDTREPAPTPGPTPLSATPSLHAYRPPAACVRVPLPRASIGVPPTAPPCAFMHAAPHLPTSHHPATPPRLFVLLPRSPLRVLHVPPTLLRVPPP